MAQVTINVKVQTTREILFQGPISALSSKNIEGKFDLLPLHANFITIIDNQPIIILKPDRQKLTFNFNQALIFLQNNQIIVFADPVKPPES